MILFLFPEIVLNFIFGSNFIQAALALRVLALGFMFNAFFGLNGETLISFGATKYLMYANIFGALSNILEYWGRLDTGLVVEFCVLWAMFGIVTTDLIFSRSWIESRYKSPSAK